MSNTDNEPKVRAIPIKWSIPPDMQALFANHMTVQHMEQTFLITFYQGRPPLTLGLDSEAIQAIEEVEAHAVAQIVVPASNMPGFVRALEDNLERYQAQQVASTNEE